MVRLLYENRFILTRRLHKEYFHSRYIKLRFRPIYFLGYRFREWLDYRELQSQHGKAVVFVVRFNSDQVQVKVNKTAFSFKYSTIESAYLTPELIVLQLKKEGMAEHVQLLYRNGFTNGTDERGFCEFLNQKTGTVLFTEEDLAATGEEDG